MNVDGALKDRNKAFRDIYANTLMLIVKKMVAKAQEGPQIVFVLLAPNKCGITMITESRVLRNYIQNKWRFSVSQSGECIETYGIHGRICVEIDDKGKERAPRRESRRMKI